MVFFAFGVLLVWVCFGFVFFGVLPGSAPL